MTTSVKRAMGYQSTQNLNVIVEKARVACQKSGVPFNSSSSS